MSQENDHVTSTDNWSSTSNLMTALEESLSTHCVIDLYHFYAKGKVSNDKIEWHKHLYVALQANTIIYALEIIVYRPRTSPTLYVSKVDSTGCHDLCHSPITSLTMAILVSLLQYYPKDHRLRLILFAKSQPQYIFPSSSANANKHVLNDQKLLKWWIRNLETVRSRYDGQARGFILVPGFNSSELRRNLPNSIYWSVGHPYKGNALATDEIENFPDDPKGRFIDDLFANKQSKDTTVDQFLIQMEYRQEMSSGHLNGFVFLEIKEKMASATKLKDVASFQEFLDEKTYKQIYQSLESGIYKTVEDTVASSCAWLRTIHALVKSHQFEKIHVTGVRTIDESASQKTNIGSVQASVSPQTGKRTGQEVNLLVPRKKQKIIHL